MIRNGRYSVPDARDLSRMVSSTGARMLALSTKRLRLFNGWLNRAHLSEIWPLMSLWQSLHPQPKKRPSSRSFMLSIDPGHSNVFIEMRNSREPAYVNCITEVSTQTMSGGSGTDLGSIIPNDEQWQWRQSRLGKFGYRRNYWARTGELSGGWDDSGRGAGDR